MANMSRVVNLKLTQQQRKRIKSLLCQIKRMNGKGSLLAQVFAGDAAVVLVRPVRANAIRKINRVTDRRTASFANDIKRVQS